MNVVVEGTEIRVYCYNCDDCEERFYTEKLLSPQDISCPYCGSSEEVAISSSHLKELYNEV